MAIPLELEVYELNRHLYPHCISTVASISYVNEYLVNIEWNNLLT